MSRPAGLSDSDSSDEFLFDVPSFADNRKGQYYDDYNENANTENKGNVWFDADSNNSIEQNNKLNTEYNTEKAVYLSTDHDEESGKKTPRLRPASPLPFSHIRMAIIQGNLPIVESFIEKGISVDQTIKSGWTLLMVAASSGQDQIVKYLLDYGASPNLHKALFTPLMAAAASERIEEKVVSCVELLIQFDAVVDAAETHGMTALMFAAKAGKTEVMDTLLRNGADVHICDNKELTALFWAASAGQLDAVKMLLDFSADPKQIAMGQNVIEAALASGNKEIACLLEKHCDGTLENKDWDEVNDLVKDKVTRDASEEEHGRYREVESLLTSIGVESFIPTFREHKVSLAGFMHLSEEDLIKMGITQFGVRFDIMTAIKNLNTEEWKTASLPEGLRKQCITLHDSVLMVRNMDEHIRYMTASFDFLRNSIQSYPKLFTMDMKSTDALHLTDYCFSYLKNVNGLKAEIEELRKFLDKKCNTMEYVKADAIQNKFGQSNWQRTSLISFGIASTLAGLLYFLKLKLFTKLHP